MKFIEYNDLKIELKEYLTDQMLDEDYSFLTDIESAAIEKVKSYSNNIINIDYEISQTGDKRNSDLKRTILILMVYDIEARLSTGDITEKTLRRYNEIMKYLNDIQKSIVIPTWLRKETGIGQTSESLFYSLKPQNIICY